MAPASPAHKPRKKRKGDSAILARTNKGTVYLDPNGNVTKPAFPLVAFLWPAIGNVSQWLVLPLILMAVGLFRWSTAFWGYSGISINLNSNESVLTSQRISKTSYAWRL